MIHRIVNFLQQFDTSAAAVTAGANTEFELPACNLIAATTGFAQSGSHTPPMQQN